MSAAERAAPVSAAEAARLFEFLTPCPAVILTVSGGPDSTALMVLAARWRKSLKRGPKLIAITVDHGLRPEARREAADVHRLARKLGIAHRTLRWTGRKPKTGLQAAAREARYRLLAAAARKAGVRHVVTAHTLDDQAETVLFRMARGSGISGLSGMGLVAPLPVEQGAGMLVVRPLLGVSKERLIATLSAAKIGFAEDPTNRDPRFARPRLRTLLPALAREGLSAERLALLARRVHRVEGALAAAVNDAEHKLQWGPPGSDRTVVLKSEPFFELPEEIALRLLGRAIAATGDEGPVELGKLEALHGGLRIAANAGTGRFRRTLAGAQVTLAGGEISIERAPPRRIASKRP